jgi:hypothetical protein
VILKKLFQGYVQQPLRHDGMQIFEVENQHYLKYERNKVNKITVKIISSIDLIIKLLKELQIIYVVSLG